MKPFLPACWFRVQGLKPFLPACWFRGSGFSAQHAVVDEAHRAAVLGRPECRNGQQGGLLARVCDGRQVVRVQELQRATASGRVSQQ